MIKMTDDEFIASVRKLIAAIAEDAAREDVAGVILTIDDLDMLKIVYKRITNAIENKKPISVNECRMMYGAMRSLIDTMLFLSSSDVETIVDVLKSKREAEEKEKKAHECKETKH